MTHQLLQILAATMVTAGLLVLAIAQLPVIGQATGTRGRDNFRLLRPGTGMKPGITREAGSEPSEILYRQLFPAPGQPAPHLLPIDNMTTRGTFNLTKGQAFVNDLLLTGETAVTNLTGPQARRCDALALDGGPGGHPKSSFMGRTLAGQPCDPFNSPGGELCFSIPLPTPWSADVNPENPLPEYPRPQLRRQRWKSLNGVWDFEPYGTWETRELPGKGPLERRIVVPFPVEAPLSGVGRGDVGATRMWYRRNFTVPEEWRYERQSGGPAEHVMLRFGAVDWEAEVFVNGIRMGLHRGGYDKFAYDITEALEKGLSGVHELAVRVFDPTESAHVPVGKQRRHPQRHPSSIWYTASSGIWQTVWLEPVPAAHIERLDITPDIDAGAVTVTVLGSKAAEGTIAHVTVLDEHGNEVGSGSGKVGEEIRAKLGSSHSKGSNSTVHLWSPDSPYLYDLDVTLKPADKSKEVTDRVKGYVGMRKISLGRTEPHGHLRPMLNNEFVFQIGFLDQGFWPDGVYTAPTDDALVSDIQFAKSLGMNLLRKHVKVEPDRWYYHCDRLGMLVWQDMPSMYWEDPFSAGPSYRSPVEKRQHQHELTRMIEEHRIFPSIIMWVVFNEGWGQYDTQQVVQLAQSLDSSRLVDPASGWVDAEAGDVIDMHQYVGPNAPLPTLRRAAVLGEFGGLGLRLEGHAWIPEDSFSYQLMASPAELEVRYLGLIERLKELMLDPVYDLNAAVYTELSDVEAEINGLITYDRQVIKVSPYALPAAHKDLLDLSRSLKRRAHDDNATGTW